MKRIRIAIYSGAIPSTTFIERLIQGVAEQGFEVMVFGKIKQPVTYASSGVKVVGNRNGMMGIAETLIRLMRLRLLEPGQYQKLKKHVGSGPFSGAAAFRSWQMYTPILLNLPDIFHIQWAKSASDWLFLKEKFGVKLVLSLRGTHIAISPLADDQLAKSYRASFPKMNAFHSVSESILEDALLYGASREKTRIIYSGLDVQNKSAKEWKRSQPLKVVVVGRFHWLKGYQYLLDALALIKKRSINVKFTLIVQGDLPEEILFQLHDLKLTEDVTWINGLPHDQVIEQMSRHDVLILPSLQEGIANVVLEAMNTGLPVISTDCGGMKEVIQEGVNGFLVPVRDPKALADAVEKFSLLSGEQIEGVRRQARSTIERKFNKKDSMKFFAEMYKEIVA